MLCVVKRSSTNDNRRWQDIVLGEFITVNDACHLDYPGCESTRITECDFSGNTVIVNTRSGAVYEIVFVLESHGKAEWLQAKQAAWKLHCKLLDQLEWHWYWK